MKKRWLPVVALVFVGVATVSCGGDDLTSTTDSETIDTVETFETTTTSSSTSTTSTSTTTTSTTLAPTTTKAPATSKAPATTKAPVTTAAAMTAAPTTATPTTVLPYLTISSMFSGSATGCDTPYSTFYLEVEVPGVVGTATVTATVEGQNIPALQGNTFTNGGYPVYFSAFPHLADGAHNVIIRATAPGYSDTSTTVVATYNCGALG